MFIISKICAFIETCFKLTYFVDTLRIWDKRCADAQVFLDLYFGNGQLCSFYARYLFLWPRSQFCSENREMAILKKSKTKNTPFSLKDSCDKWKNWISLKFCENFWRKFYWKSTLHSRWCSPNWLPVDITIYKIYKKTFINCGNFHDI